MCTLTAVGSTITSTLQIRQQQKPAQGPSQAIRMNNLSGVAVGDPQEGTVGNLVFSLYTTTYNSKVGD